MLVGLAPKGADYEKVLSDMEELNLLVKTYGGEVYAATVQKADFTHRETFIGTGKAQEVAEKIAEEKIDFVVINGILKPGQLYTLKKIFERSNPNIKVWDRINLILQIFALHAHTKEAKLQIDLAGLRHMGPRLWGMGYILSRQGGGIGTTGVGETNTELMRRHWRNEMRHIKEQLAKLSKDIENQIQKRKDVGFSTVAIVGYTNAGKTMLFNQLTKKKNLVADALFATLDSSAGKLDLSGKKNNVIVTDTIGFIKNLPMGLVDAFKSTLLESIHADLLLVVIDASDPQYREKILVVEEILHELFLDKKDRIYVFNKIDKVKSLNKEEITKIYNSFPPLFICAKTGEGLNLLREKISARFIS